MMDNERRELVRETLRGMKKERHKLGYGDDLRLAVSSDMMLTLMSDGAARVDFNLTTMPYSEEWQGVHVNIDRRLDREGLPEFEFSKVWTAKTQNIWEHKSRPLLKSGASLSELMTRKKVLPTDKEVLERGKN